MKTRILSQGMLDSACLLYAIVNAAKSLTHPRHLTHTYTETGLEAKWRAIVNTTSPTRFLNGDGSDVDGGLSPEQQFQVVNSFLQTAMMILSDTGPPLIVQHISLEEFRTAHFRIHVVIFVVLCK